MEKKSDTGAPAFTVRQLSELFGKSEDTIRRWKNEGVGKGEENVKLRSIEQGDPNLRRNSRHLSFTREAVREFVEANPFLMDDAPALRRFMEEGRRITVIPLPASLEKAASGFDGEEGEAGDEPGEGFLRRFIGSWTPPDDEDFEFDEDEQAWEEKAPPRRPGGFSDREEEGEDDAAERRRKQYDEATIRYMLRLLRRREADCRREMDSISRASTIFYRRRDIADALADGGYYISDLVQQREEQLDAELEKIRETTRALEGILW